MTPEEQKDKRIEYIQEMIYKYTKTEPVITMEELAYAVMFNLDSDEFLKAVKKEYKSKW